MPGGVQGYDRYAYVNNNPLRYTDPTGHSTWDGSNEGSGSGHSTCDLDCWRAKNQGDETDTNSNGVPDLPIATYEIEHPDHICEYGNLVECTYSRGYWPEGDYTFSDEEWKAFTITLFLDILRRSSSWYSLEYNHGDHEWPFAPFHSDAYYERKIYDTVFWNGDSSGVHALTGDVCFNDGACHSRNDVNYIAQGMWSAADHEGHWGAEWAANSWKQQQYHHDASPEVLYWVNVGVDTYNNYAMYGYR